MDHEQRTERAGAARAVAAELARREVVAIAVTWVDNSGITRVKGVPLARLPHAAAWGVGATPAFDAFLVDDSLVAGRYAGGPAGDLRLHPDLSRVTVLAAQPGWAWAPADRYDQDGRAHPQDARAVAARQVAALAGDGYSVLAGFEVEWCVSTGPGDDYVPACTGPAYGMSRLVQCAGYLSDVVSTLEGQGIAVAQIHPEYTPGQFEVSVAPEEPVAAADTAVLVRETIRAVSARHGLRPTFAPKVLADGVGNGGHVHLSLWRDGRNLMTGGAGRYGLTPEATAFAGGVLARLPALLAVGAPSVASYLRLIPSHWAGAFACWGLENREAALRLVPGPDGDRARAANVEVKCVDQAANPYLLVAALLAAGRAGLAEGAGLPEPVDVDPATVPAAERAARGIAALPADLSTAVAAFEKDPVLAEAFGPELADTVAAVRRGEVAAFAGADPERITRDTRWRW
jgi:glutamine synthetase